MVITIFYKCSYMYWGNSERIKPLKKKISEPLMSWFGILTSEGTLHDYSVQTTQYMTIQSLVTGCPYFVYACYLCTHIINDKSKDD